MNKTLTLSIATALAMAVFSTTAFAGPIIDKGDLGKYERQGRFVKRIVTPEPRAAAPQVAAVADDDQADINKGELGKYERHGRFVKRIANVVPRNWEQKGGYFQEAAVMHDHGINSKEHKNVSR